LGKQFIVGDSRQRDVGRGIARIDVNELKELSLEAGDVIGLEGKKKTLAIAWPAYSEDQGKNIIRIDGFIRRNAGVAINEKIKAFLPSTTTANALLLAPIDMRLNVDEDFTNFVKNRLEGRPGVKGDIMLVTMLGHAIPFSVIRVHPGVNKHDGIIVQKTTRLAILNEPYKPAKREFSDMKFLFRVDWLQSIIQRLKAGRTTFAIMGTKTEAENETEILEKAKALSEESFDSLEISVNFYS
jgi:hypothetical protein